jgi:hypothetical protein
MDTQDHLEPDAWWSEGGEDRARLWNLLELVRREQETELSPERREHIRARVLARLERHEARRRRRRAVVRVASTLFLAGLMLTLVVRARAG